jgi:hypothetical protein
MESRLLSSLGKVAGLAGISFGVFLLLFNSVLQKQFLPQAGLGSAQAFAVILSLMLLTFGIAGIGIIAWLVSRNMRPEAPIPGRSLAILASLIALVMAVVLGSAVLVGQQAKPDPGGLALATPPSPVRADTKLAAPQTEAALPSTQSSTGANIANATAKAGHSVPSEPVAQPNTSPVELNAKTKGTLAICITASKSGPMEIKALEELRDRLQYYGFRVVRDCNAAALSITVASVTVDEPVRDSRLEQPAYTTTAHLEVPVEWSAQGNLLFSDTMIDAPATGVPGEYPIFVQNEAVMKAAQKLVDKLRLVAAR